MIYERRQIWAGASVGQLNLAKRKLAAECQDMAGRGRGDYFMALRNPILREPWMQQELRKAESCDRHGPAHPHCRATREQRANRAVHRCIGSNCGGENQKPDDTKNGQKSQLVSKKAWSHLLPAVKFQSTWEIEAGQYDQSCSSLNTESNSRLRPVAQDCIVL